jgi:GT2 family glycosyltransferase
VLLLRSQAIRQCGGLRAEFFAYVEDAELSYRWQRAGWQLYWVPAALARHHVPRHAGAPSPFAIRYRDRNRRRVASLHYGVWQRVGFWLFFAPSRLLQLVRFAMKADVARALAVWRGLVHR